MAFLVEDGTGLAAANSYVSVADADTYHGDRGNDGWTGTDAVKQAALIKATQFIDGTYAFIANNAQRDPLTGFGGPLVSNDQALSWPRVNVIDKQNRPITGVPQKVKDATCELALLALSDDLLPTEDRATKREKVGDLEVEYMDSAANHKRYPYVTRLLRDLIISSGASRKLVRA